MKWQLKRFFQVLKEQGLVNAIISVLNHLEVSFLYPLFETKLLVNGGFRGWLLRLRRRPHLKRQIGEGEDFYKKDWDTLILLDAYRADFFEEHSELEGNYSRVVSKGTWSLEFVVRNFGGDKKLHDTVVVTGNAYYVRYPELLSKDTFHDVIHLANSNEEGTLDPNKVTEAAMDAHKRYPNKRIIVHYMQPHSPHISEVVDKYRDKLGEDYNSVFQLFEEGKISKKELEKSYISTIREVEPEVKRLIRNIEGKIVVGSDHGENLGEQRFNRVLTGHGFETKECKLVPWLEIPFDKRRKIKKEKPVDSEPVDIEELESQLADLGYR